ncbi:MAG: ABC transporter ATP-binding protein [Thermodesulfobacteriota bacterium]
MAAKIIIRDLTKIFEGRKTSVKALAGVNLSIEEGEFLCILGPSGCGKTTILRIMAGLETATSGEVVISQADKSRPLNSMVFQEHSLFPWLTVIDNVAFGLEMRGFSKNERHHRAAAFLETVGLSRFSHHFPHQLSGGMKQRVSLARAFVNDPEILLMDEPFASLDAQNKILLQDELLKIWEECRKTVVYITHSIDEALLLGDRIVVMTAAPGIFKEVMEVQFGRPRDVFEIKAKPEFGEMSLKIWKILESEVRKAREAEL